MEFFRQLTAHVLADIPNALQCRKMLVNLIALLPGARNSNLKQQTPEFAVPGIKQRSVEIKSRVCTLQFRPRRAGKHLIKRKNVADGISYKLATISPPEWRKCTVLGAIFISLIFYSFQTKTEEKKPNTSPLTRLATNADT